MNLAVPTSIFGDASLDEAARLAGAAGYDAVRLDLDVWQLNVADGGLTGALAGRIAETFERQGVGIAAIAVEADLLGGGAAAVDQVVAVVQCAPSFGADLVIASSGPGDDWTLALDSLEELVGEASARDVAIAVDLAPGMAIGDLDEGETLLDAIESDFLGLSLDILGLAAREGLTPQEVLERVGDDLLVVTVSDPTPAGLAAPAPASPTDFGSLFELLGRYAPDVIVVAGGVVAADAAATRLYLAQFL